VSRCGANNQGREEGTLSDPSNRYATRKKSWISVIEYRTTRLNCNSLIVLSRHPAPPILCNLFLEPVNPADHRVRLELLLRLHRVSETATPTLPGILGDDVGDCLFVDEMRSSADVVQEGTKVYQSRQEGDVPHRLNILMSNDGLGNAFRLILARNRTLLPLLQQIQRQIPRKELIAEPCRRDVLVRRPNIMQHRTRKPRLIQLSALLQTPIRKALLRDRDAVRVDPERMTVGILGELGAGIVVDARAECRGRGFQIGREDRLGRFRCRRQLGLVRGDGCEAVLLDGVCHDDYG
jgi:hypothetical protein